MSWLRATMGSNCISICLCNQIDKCVNVYLLICILHTYCTSRQVFFCKMSSVTMQTGLLIGCPWICDVCSILPDWSIVIVWGYLSVPQWLYSLHSTRRRYNTYSSGTLQSFAEACCKHQDRTHLLRPTVWRRGTGPTVTLLGWWRKHSWFRRRQERKDQALIGHPHPVAWALRFC